MIAESLELIRVDLLKLWRRRGLMGIAALVAIGTVSLIFLVRAIRHGMNPHHVGVAGGANTFEGATQFVALIAVAIAAMIGVTAGAGDAELGVLRDLFATGRSRLVLFASRTFAALVMTLGYLTAALAIVTVCSVVFAGTGNAHDPSIAEVVRRAAATLAFSACTTLVCAGIATLSRSRGPMMACVITFGILISELLLRTGFLGALRDALPMASFDRMAGDTVSGLHTPLGVAIGVLIAWALAALAGGGWWVRRVEV